MDLSNLKILLRFGVLSVALSLVAATAWAQFKEIKAAPFSSAIARQKIRALLENVDASNRDQTVATISDWLKWFRDIVDEELFARWKSDGRGNVPLVMAPLADARLAHDVIDFSWRVDPADTFTLAYAPMLGDLMARYPESARPMLDDLLPPAGSGPPTVNLTPAASEAVCRILLDMPDNGTWRKTALAIVPRYRAAADRILKQDLNSPDQERTYRAMRWRADLGLDPPPPVAQKLVTRRDAPATARQQIVGPTRSPGYAGPVSGTFQSNGELIPENGEYVFPNIPPVKLMLDFDTKHWEARLVPGEGQTQNLVLRNKGKGPQKRCVVHWSIVP